MKEPLHSKAQPLQQKAIGDATAMPGMQPPVFQLQTSGEQEGTLPPAPTQTPDEIRDGYQVEDDNMTTWTPKALGIEIPGAPSRRMTETEGEMLDGLVWQHGLVELLTFQEIHDTAFSEAEARVPNPSTIPSYVPADRQAEWLGNDGHRDAFRHCYWNALLARHYGQAWAREFATAHEGGPGNPAEREAMDLYNNEVGRAIQAANPRANDEELAAIVFQAMNAGRLVVIDQSSNIAFSNTVPLWQHGFTGDATAAGVIPTPGGDASAQKS